MAHIFDRIDLKPIGTWVNNFKPNGVTLNFSFNLDGGKYFDALQGVELPFGAIIGRVFRPVTSFAGITINRVSLPKDIFGSVIPYTAQAGIGVQFSRGNDPTGAQLPGPTFTAMVIPAGTLMPAGLYDGTNYTSIPSQLYDVDTTLAGPITIEGSDCIIPYGVTVSGSIDAMAYTDVTVSKLDKFSLAAGTVTADGILFARDVELFNVAIPFGTNFTKAMDIGHEHFSIGVYQAPIDDQFQMNTTQLIDVNGKAIFSVHGIDSNELVAFTRPTANIARLVMYAEGVGVDSMPFACYSIVFKTNVTAAQAAAFNLLHPSDVNPIIVDNGTVSDPNILIPVFTA